MEPPKAEDPTSKCGGGGQARGRQESRRFPIVAPPRRGPIAAHGHDRRLHDSSARYCAKLDVSLNTTSRSYTRKLRMVDKAHRSENPHGQARRGARAGGAAQTRRGISGRLYDFDCSPPQGDRGAPTFDAYAIEPWLDLDRFAKDMADSAGREAVAAAGTTAGALGSPASRRCSSNGRADIGERPIDGLVDAVENARSRGALITGRHLESSHDVSTTYATAPPPERGALHVDSGQIAEKNASSGYG